MLFHMLVMTDRSLRRLTSSRSRRVPPDMSYVGSFSSILDEPSDSTPGSRISKRIRNLFKEKNIEERLVRQGFVMKHRDSLRLVNMDK